MSSSIMIVAGERSGDIYGAGLARALQSRLENLEIFGCGGEAMRLAGVETLVDAHQLNMIGIAEILGGLPKAYRAFQALLEQVERRRPSLAVLIDFPDFNLRLAKRLKRKNVPVVYFVSPQIWAWRKSRLKQLKARIDKMLCIFRFEEAIYRDAGIPVEYVGYPLMDLERPHISRQQFFAGLKLDPNATGLALLPGSREKEVTKNLPTMLEAAHLLAGKRRAQFVVAVAPTLQPEWVQKLIDRHSGPATVRAAVNATHDALEHCDLAIVASGTATMEAALSERPMVVVYRVSTPTWLLGSALVDVPFYSMVNILAGKLVVPELIQRDFTAANVLRQVEYLLEHPQAREEMKLRLRAVKRELGPGGAFGRAADAVAGVLMSYGAAKVVRSRESGLGINSPPAA